MLALPVSVDGWPVALLEFDDPAQITHEITPVLDIAGIQLGFVAQREANLTHMAHSAEHLGRLTLVATASAVVWRRPIAMARWNGSTRPSAPDRLA